MSEKCLINQVQLGTWKCVECQKVDLTETNLEVCNKEISQQSMLERYIYSARQKKIIWKFGKEFLRNCHLKHLKHIMIVFMRVKLHR